MIARGGRLHYCVVTSHERKRGPARPLAVGALGLSLLACSGTISESATEGEVGGVDVGAGGLFAHGAADAGGVVSTSGGGNAGRSGVAGAGGVSSARGGATGAAGTSVAPGGATSACNGGVADPGAAPLRRLTRNQYVNTLKDLLGSVPDLSAAFSSPEIASGLGASQGDISQVEVEDFQRAAELVAAAAVNGEALSKLAPCAKDAAPRTCAGDFVKQFGSRAYRAPLTEAAEIERHLKLFDVGASTDYRHGIELLLRGMLQSSRFLYRVETGVVAGASAKAVPLSGYEVAARLSYTFWDTLPDSKLSQAAATGELSSAAGVSAALTQVLSDAKGKPALRRFLEAFVHLPGLDALVKDTKLYPEWNAGLRASMAAQARRFFEHVLSERQGSLQELLTSDTVFVDAKLGSYYGLSGGSELTAHDLTNGRASGLLTLPALLTVTSKPDESSPIYRGKFVRELLLCQSPPAPPPDIPPAPEVEMGVSTRERLRQHEVDPGCKGCHRLLDPIGFGFEHYDAIGRYREQDGGAAVDARGEILGAGALDGAFDGVSELAARLAGSEQVEECVARQWFRYVFSRFEQTADACAVEQVVAAFRERDASLNALPQAIVNTDAFRYRRPIVTSAP